MQQAQSTPDSLPELEQERAALQNLAQQHQNTIIALRFALNQHMAMSRAEADSLREQLVATQQLVEITRSYLAESEHRLARLSQSYADEIAVKEQLRAMLAQRNIFFRLFRRGGRIDRLIFWPIRRAFFSGDADIKASVTQITGTDGTHH
jgi:hypothetical protein